MRPDISSAGIASRRPERNKIHESRMPDDRKNRRRNLAGRGLDRKRLHPWQNFCNRGGRASRLCAPRPTATIAIDELRARLMMRVM